MASSSTEATSTEAAAQLSQPEYSETPYRDTAWEMVGPRLDALTFSPLQIEVIPREHMVVDPMFADYGGRPQGEGQTERWHLPDGESPTSLNKPSAAQEAAAGPAPLNEEQIARIKAEALEQAESTLRAQYEEQLKQHSAATAHRFEALFKDMLAQQSETLALIEQRSVELALAISKKLIDTIVEVNPEYILPIVKQAINQSGSATIKRVRVSPQDLEFIEVEGIAKNLKAYDGSWQFEADASIKSGCVLETTGSTIDFQLDPAWERIRDLVVKVGQ